MAGTRFKLDSGGIKEMLKGSIGDAACRPVAEQVLARAKASAPDGEYAASVHMVEEDHPTRKAFHIVASVEWAAVAEARGGILARSL